MNIRNTLDLRTLAATADAPPFGFEEFERRRARVRYQGRAAGWSAAAALGVLTVVPVVAVLTRPAPDAQLIAPPPDSVLPVAEVFRQPPALVDMDRFAVTSELEDYIALLDAQISAARLQPLPAEEIRRLESTRRQLDESLQQVAHAHALLDL